jgi:hypothetical protein
MASSISEKPPSTSMLAPVMKPAPADVRNTITAACRRSVRAQSAALAPTYLDAEYTASDRKLQPAGTTGNECWGCIHSCTAHSKHPVGKQSMSTHLFIGSADAPQGMPWTERRDQVILRLLQQ